jgi:hypothetical protein
MTLPYAQTAFNQAKAAVDKMFKDYNAPKETYLEIRHLEKLDRILDAATPKDAEVLAAKAVMTAHMTILHLLSKGKILGRNPTAAYERKARKAESRARMFEKKAESKFETAEDAERFRASAAKEKEKALELWKLAGIEPPTDLVFTDEELTEAAQEIDKKKVTSTNLKAKKAKKGKK